MSINKDEEKKGKLTEEVHSDQGHLPEDQKKESENGDGYVPPTPEVPSANNARQHDEPITSKTPRAGQH